MKYLITGGAGFIGSNIVAKLVEQGETVRVLDNFSSGRLSNLEALADRIEIIDGDIRDYWTVRDAVEGMDYVLHQAAVASVPRSVENPLSTHAINVDGALNVLEAARLAGVKKLVTASSSAVYGDDPELPKRESMKPAPMSPYAVHKLTNEYYCRMYWELYRFPTVALRYFNVFGPRQDPKSEYAAVIPKFITRLAAGQAPTVFGDGEQTRDFIYVDNCVAANILAATSDDLVGEAYNVACGEKYTLNQLLDTLRGIIGVDVAAVYDPPREGDILHSYATIDKIAKVGFEPKVSLEDGLRKTVDYFREP